MRNAEACSVCGNITSKFLFNDRKTGVTVCSWNCERKYLDALSQKEETRILNYLDDKIEKNKRNDRIGWTIAGSGLAIVAIGFFLKSAEVFIAGVFPLTFGAFSTRHFEDRINKLRKQKMHIRI